VSLEEFADRLSATWWHHPWLPSITVGDRVMGPRQTGWTEAALGALAGTPLDERERLDAVVLVTSHIRATHSAATPGTQAWTASGAAPIMRDLLIRNADRFPLLAAIEATPSATTTREFGLRAILDGLEHAITQRAHNKAPMNG
jgi:hypothetical protein